MADLLNVLLRRLFPGLAFRCIEHEGKLASTTGHHKRFTP